MCFASTTLKIQRESHAWGGRSGGKSEKRVIDIAPWAAPPPPNLERVDLVLERVNAKTQDVPRQPEVSSTAPRLPPRRSPPCGACASRRLLRRGRSEGCGVTPPARRTSCGTYPPNCTGQWSKHNAAFVGSLFARGFSGAWTTSGLAHTQDQLRRPFPFPIAAQGCWILAEGATRVWMNTGGQCPIEDVEGQRCGGHLLGLRHCAAGFVVMPGRLCRTGGFPTQFS